MGHGRERRRRNRHKKNNHGRKGDAVGRLSEKIKEAALLILKQRGRIHDFRKEDKQGHDWVIQITPDVTVTLETKSSEAGAAKHRKRYPHKPVIAVGNSKDELTEDEFRKKVEKTVEKVDQWLSKRGYPPKTAS